MKNKEWSKIVSLLVDGPNWFEEPSNVCAWLRTMDYLVWREWYFRRRHRLSFDDWYSVYDCLVECDRENRRRGSGW